MVSVKHQPHYSLISLQPNRSADWVHNKWLMAGMAGVALIIATMWAFFGIWIVFPFAGIEVGLLCYLLYRVSHNTYRTQTLSFEKDYVHIHRQLLHLVAGTPTLKCPKARATGIYHNWLWLPRNTV